VTGALVNPFYAARIQRAVARLPMAGPFARYALTYRQHGYAPVPVRPGSKAPHVADWSRWCNELPPLELLHEWAKRYPEAGLSLALGPASGMVALDLDHDIDGLHDRVREAAGSSPVAKRGQKGPTLFYRYTGERSRSFRRQGQTVAEILAGGRLVILPPTLHPATGQPYVWLTPVTLLDIAPGTLPPLDAASVAALFEPPPQPPRRKKSHPERETLRSGTLAATLAHIPACCDYYSWVQVGMALKAELGEAGFELWDGWSAGSPKYDARQMAAKWRSFSGKGITAGTLFHIAKQHGWRRSRR
jgi:Primase C terminal 2 (PriCT-2)/Bifunctional DNA primase/polymerase, N-terminal